MATTGRISGQLLKDNLLREGKDLSLKDRFSDTALLKLNINNKRVGVNLDAPVRDLTVNGTTQTIDLIVTDRAEIADTEIISTQISNLNGNENTYIDSTSEIRSTGVRTDHLLVNDNYIRTETSDANIELRPNQIFDLEAITYTKVTPITGTIGEEFGYKVAVNSNKVVVGVDKVGSNGVVYVFDLDNTGSITSVNQSYTTIQSSDITSSDKFGLSVAVDNKIIIGAPFKNNERGAVYVYDLNGTNEYKITTSDSNQNLFGWSLAVNGTTLVVGAPNDNNNTGAIYLINTSTFTQTKITPSDGTSGDYFGWDVAVSDNKIVVGSVNHNGTGAVYVYDINGTNEIKIVASDIFTNDAFGNSVAIGYNKIIVGAPLNDDAGPSSGCAYIYDLDGTNEVKLTASDPASFDEYGTSVAIGENKIVIGSPKNDDTGSASGSIYVYDLSGLNELKLSPEDASANDQFGNHVAIGSRKIVSGSYRDDLNGFYTGSAYVYDLYNPGSLEIDSNLDIFANLYTTQNISLGGNITFGNEGSDTIEFKADIESDLSPDQPNVRSLGNETNTWKELYSYLLNGETFNSQVINAGGLDIGTISGNVFFVATGGSDTNKGDHPQDPVRSLKRALELADGSDAGPISILLYPGEYEEICPLTVPANVSIYGYDIRNTIIKPTTSTNDSDIFLLTGETTIHNLTIKDFFYNTINNTGYAFRFAPDAIVTTRSPYIQNVTVITQGSVTSISDPRGFDTGDAGKGALVDGSSVNANSRDASMLFHSVTFITPGVDGLTMTNGVRVEWLNSFTYFANNGLYATQGTLGFASQGTRFGAEIRSIASANVYGNYGAVADGADTLMYLIGHNFAYIGVGKDVSNDKTLVVDSNRVAELNSGKIYHTSTDHRGTYSVGKEFFVNFDDGKTSISNGGVNLSGLTRIKIIGPGPDTIIEAEKVDVGYIRISGNTIESTNYAVNITSASQTTNLLSDVNIQDDLDITGNLVLGGTLIRLGDQPTDTITFETELDQNFIPDLDSTYSLGSPTKNWWKANLSGATISSIDIYDNVITTNETNADLDLRANGAGRVRLDNVIANSNVLTTDEFDLIFTPSETLKINTTGALVLPRGTNQQRVNNIADLRYNTETNIFEGYDGGNVGFGGVYSSDRTDRILAHPTNNTLLATVNNQQIMQVSLSTISLIGLQVDDIRFNNNLITTNVSNSNLELRTTGSGELVLDEIRLKSNTITNTSNNNLVFDIPGNSYLKAGGTLGVSIPVGDDSTRAANPIIGDSRYNTERLQMEVYDGEKWIAAVGEGDTVTEDYLKELVDIYTLVLG